MEADGVLRSVYERSRDKAGQTFEDFVEEGRLRYVRANYHKRRQGELNELEPEEPLGELVQDRALPYPYNFPEPERTPEPGGVMRVAASWDFQSLDPVDSAAGGTVTVPNMVYNRLIGFTRGPRADVFQPQIEPELAAFWERSPDGLTFTFQIQDNVTWQNVAPLNGRRFTAEDAAYALNRYATEGVHTSYYANVAGFEAPDDLTMKVHMARATADFLNPLASNKQTIFPREIIACSTDQRAASGTHRMLRAAYSSGWSGSAPWSRSASS